MKETEIPESLYSDEKKQEELNQYEVIDYFQTDIINGRHVQCFFRKDRNINFSLENYRLKFTSPGPPVQMLLTEESFCLLLEAMLHAEKEFGIDRKASLKKLLAGKKLDFKKTFIA